MEAAAILGHSTESGAVTPQRLREPRLSEYPAQQAAQSSPKSRSPRGQRQGITLQAPRTNGHADLCLTVCACDPNCADPQLADRWIFEN